MLKRSALALGLGVLFAAGSAHAGSHKFFVTCEDGHRVFVKAKYGDVDPGKEWARMSVAKKFAPFHGNACSAADYGGDAQCLDCPWETFEAGTINGDELARLGAGDLTVIPEVVIGVPLRVSEKAIDEVGRVGRRLKLWK